MATTLNFPSSPNTNDTYSFGGKTWTYNGTAWKLNSTPLTTTNVAEGTNLYFNNARARAAISVAGSGSYDQNTGVITVTGGVTSVNGQTGAATGFATTANSLSQFASTTSAELATLISDETGTGSVVFSASPALTGTPTAPTAANNVSTTQIATTEFVKNAVANLVDGAPALLDTLNELAAAINDDASFSVSIANTISTAQTTANNAFGQANTATLAASSAFGQANTATLASAAGYAQANTATLAASAAFDSANTKVATVAGVTSTTISNAQIASGISSSGILTTANVSELTNQYFTNARARGAISVAGAGSYDSGTGVITITGGVTSVGGATGDVSNAQLASGITTSGVLNTSNVAEGANLYFTTSRARASIDAAAGGPITYNATTGNVALSTSGVTPDTYGGASKVPVFTVDTYGRITSAANVNVAGVSTFSATGNTFTIGTADGGSFSASIQPDSVILGRDTTGAYLSNIVAGTGISISGLGNEGATPTISNAGVLSVNGQTGAATGFATTANSLAQFASTTSAEIRTLVSDETGSGSLVFSDSPVLITPNIGTASYAVLTNATGLPISTGVSGLGAGVATFLATPSSANLAGALTDESGSNTVAFTNSPVLVTPNIGTPSYAVLTNATGLPLSTGISGLGSGQATLLGGAAATGVTANTYGGASKVPVITVDQYGRITSASNVSVAGVSTFTASGNTFTIGTADGGSFAASIQPNSVELGRDTTGAYVGNIVAGTGVTLTGLAGENAVPTIAIGQAVGTTADVTFNTVTTTGNINVGGAVIISGNLYVAGTTTSVNSNVTTLEDSLIFLADNSTSDVLDIGFIGSFNDGVQQHTGFVRDSSDGVYKLFANVIPEPNASGIVDFTNATYSALRVGELTVSGLTNTGNVNGSNALITNALTAGTIQTTGNVNANNLRVATNSSLGTVVSGTWNGAEIGTAYTAAKVTSVNGQVGAATGFATTANSLSQFASTSSSELATLISDETGTGSLVFGTSPVLLTPNIGTPSTAILTNATGLPVATGISGLGAGVAAFLATPSSTNLITAVTDESGTGNLLFSNSPVMSTPNIGTPSYAVLTNATGLPLNGLSGLGANVATFLADPTSAKLAFAVSDETGSGSLVFSNSPVLVTPNIGTPSTAILTNATGLPVSTGVSGLGGNVATLLGLEAKTGVTATTYGSALNIPVITVDEYGRISSAANVALVSGVSSVGGATGAVSNAQLASAITSSGVLTTANVAEVTNLYFSNTRSRQALSAGTGIGYDSATGVISSTITQYTDTNARGAISKTGTKGSYDSGTGVFDFSNIANVTVSASAPGSPNIGDLWIDDADGNTYLYFNDGTSSQWVEQASGTVISSMVESVGGSTGAISNVMIATALTGLNINVGNLTPTGNLIQNLGSPTNQFKDLYLSNSTIFLGSLQLKDTGGALTVTSPGGGAAVSYARTTDKLSAFAATTSSELAGVISDETGSGALVFATSPTLVTPVLGVASATSINSTTIPSSKTLVVTTDKLNVLAATSSSELAGIISDETGTGALVFGTSPAITTSLTTGSSSFDLINTTATTVNFAKAATTLSMGAATGTTTVNNNLTVAGNLQVSGTTTTVNSATLDVTDKNITVAKGAANSAAADGAGITVDGASATFNYVHATTAWTSSQDINLASGKVYEINGTSVLSGSTLGSGVTASSLTSVGTIATGVWQGTAIATTYGGTGNSTGYASGGAASAATATVVDDTATNATYYPMLGQATSGNTAPKVSSTKLTFNPSTGLLTSTDYNSSSDERLKKNIKTVDSALDTVQALRGVTFEWKEGGAKSIGMIAQEVQEVIPDVVTTDDNGYMGIKYTNVVGVLVEAIKELKAEFEAYKKTHP